MFKKSIVIKQFLLYMATISFCVILMGGMLSVIYTNHYMSETKQELIEQGEKIAGAINKAYNTGNINNLAYEMQVLEDYMGCLLYTSTNTNPKKVSTRKTATDSLSQNCRLNPSNYDQG